MIKHKLIINGTHTIDSTVLTGFTLTESVNEGQDLTLGSVCSAMMEFSVRVVNGAYLPQYGDKIDLFESDGGEFIQHGIFYVEKTNQVTDKVYKATSYDAVSRLDKDITEWLQTVTFPISLYDLTNRAIQQCGIEIKNTSIPNGDYQVNAFQASGITARNICRWAGEISARFCHATDDGKIEFAWYTPASIDIAYSKHECDIEHFYHGNELKITGKCIKADYVGGVLSMDSGLFGQSYANGELNANYTDSAERLNYYMNSFNREAFQTAKVEKVQIQSTQNDIGTIFPDSPGEKNTYKITGNYLLTADSGTALKPIAEYIYNQLKNVTYTPANVAYPSDFRVKVGNTVKIITADGKNYTTYVMKRTESGSKDSIFCYGNKTRQSSTAVNNQSFKSLYGRMTEIKADVDGVSVRVEEVNQSAADNLKDFSDAVTSEIDGIKNQLDGVVDTWYGEEIPTESNYPAGDWTTPTEKEKHSGDLYYVVGSGPDSGNAYRWIFLNGKWYWDKLANSDIAKALEAAAKAQDTADGKRRVFIDTPYTPYDAGDLWANGEAGQIMRCINSRQSGAYQSSDWGPADNTGKRFSEFQQTVDGITAEVADLSNSTSSRFSQTATEISAKVSSRDGDYRTFGWELTSDKWAIVSKGYTVFQVNESGAFVKGEIRSDRGNIGGWEITKDAISAGSTALHSDGSFSSTNFGFDAAGNVYMTGTIQAKAGKIGGWSIGDNYISAGNTALYSDGSISCTNFYVAPTGEVTVTGTINAVSGNLGKWSISDYISAKSAEGERVLISVPDQEGFGGSVIRVGGSPANGNSDNFVLYQDGSISARSGVFAGEVHAGKITYGAGEGYFSGSGLAGKSVGTSKTSDGINTSLGYADYAHKVFNGDVNAVRVGATSLSAGSTFWFRGHSVSVKLMNGTYVLTVPDYKE